MGFYRLNFHYFSLLGSVNFGTYRAIFPLGFEVVKGQIQNMSFDKKSYEKQWKRENKDRINAGRRALEATRREKRRVPIRIIPPKSPQVSSIRREQIRFLNGWIEDAYEVEMDRQGWSCATCHKKFNRENEVQADHCHKTGKHRGLLCKRCNMWLGITEAMPELFKSFIEYQEKWNAINSSGLAGS